MPIQTENLHIDALRLLPAPADLATLLPRDQAISRTVSDSRAAIRAILSGADHRLLVIVGPCSIHDPDAALDYAAHLARERHRLSDRLEIVMRTYFEKPRTTVGWKGLINDPHLDGSDRIEDGLPAARRLLLEINRLGLPTATEFLDPILPQYFADLIAWGAIGARTTESQIHRQLASGLSCPVGFKNGTDGGVQVALDAIRSAAGAHSFRRSPPKAAPPSPARPATTPVIWSCAAAMTDRITAPPISKASPLPPRRPESIRASSSTPATPTAARIPPASPR